MVMPWPSTPPSKERKNEGVFLPIAVWQRWGIDEPWTCSSFIGAVVEVQKERQINPGNSARIQFYDRSPICTLALANWLGHPAIIPSAGESSSGPARASTAQKEITSDTNNAKMADMK